MGRAPCCDKAKVKKGPWSPEEDATLKAYIEQNGTGGNWIALPQKIGLKRCGKSCRLRWLNYLRPNIKHGGFSEEEDNIICSLYISIGSRWSIIAAQLPGRTDNDIKNYWNTRLKKKLLGKQRKEQAAAAAAKRASLKPQILKTESDHSLMVPGGGMIMNNQTQYYWPELPAVIMPPGGGLVNQTQLDPNFKDQEFLKNFLIKLQGGKISDYHHQLSNTTATANNVQYPFDVSFSQDHEQLYDSTITTMLASPPTSMNSMNSSTTASRLQDTHEYNIIGADMIINQGLENYPVEPSHDDHLIYNNNNQQQRLDIINGVENFYGMDQMVNNNGSTGTTSTSAESNSWEDISSLVYPNSMVSHDYEICQQHSTFEQPAYLFGHQ